MVSFRREKFVSRGGPDGGDGGRGGDVELVARRESSTLHLYRGNRRWQAHDGMPGGANRRRGASGEALSLTVPVGSVIREVERDGSDAEQEPLADLTEDGMFVVVARGGRGGWGNKRFATPTRQAPKFAQRGASGIHRQLSIELKLIADVGLIGLPNAGKSTLLRAWTAATPKVASYPFTTLEPGLGVVEFDYESFVAADMPGLIEGASSGVGLGHEFLRHIERTRVLVHLLDMTRDDPLLDRQLIDAELAAFGHGLAEKPQLLALNKVDHPDARAHMELLTEGESDLGAPWVAISGLTGEGTRTLARQTLLLLREAIEIERREEKPSVLRPKPQRPRFTVRRDAQGVVIVEGPTPEWLAQTLDLSNEEARQELFQRLRRMGVGRAVRREGVGLGDLIRIGTVDVRWEP